jgi:hypothetical protein
MFPHAFALGEKRDFLEGMSQYQTLLQIATVYELVIHVCSCYNTEAETRPYEKTPLSLRVRNRLVAGNYLAVLMFLDQTCC